jgi:hypothetical protein
MVLLEHVKEGGDKSVYITATRISATTSFQCQKSVTLNGKSWSAIGFTTKTQKNFVEPLGGFVDSAEFVDGTLRFTVIGYNKSGYLPAWEEIVKGRV